MRERHGWWRPRKVAEYLDCSERHVYDLVAEGKLKAYHLGPRALRISEASIEQFITENLVESTEKK